MHRSGWRCPPEAAQASASSRGALGDLPVRLALLAALAVLAMLWISGQPFPCSLESARPPAVFPAAASCQSCQADQATALCRVADHSFPQSRRFFVLSHFLFFCFPLVASARRR